MLVSTEQTRVKWEDIPPEIIDEIIRHVDHTSLVSLGQMNRHLNFSALASWLGPRRQAELVSGHILDYQEHVQRTKDSGFDYLNVLSKAIWIQGIRYITWKATDISDFQALSTIIENAAAQLETLSVRISYETLMNIDLSDSLAPMNRFIGVINSRPCKSVTLEEYDHDVRRGNMALVHRRLRTSNFTSRRRVHRPSWLENLPIPTPQLVVSNPPLSVSRDSPTDSLEELLLNYSILPHPHFILFNTFFLRHTSTLKRIAIWGIIPDPDELWKVMFSTTFLVLEHLAIKNYIPDVELVKFVARHPTITLINIQQPLNCSSVRQSEGHPGVLWPNLTQLGGDPATLIYFLSHTNMLPKLQLVRLQLVQYDDWTYRRDVLSQCADVLHAFMSTPLISPPSLYLEIDVSLSWGVLFFASLLGASLGSVPNNAGRQATSDIIDTTGSRKAFKSTLTRLTVNNLSADAILSSPQWFIDIWKIFISQFPSLQQLHFRQKLFVEDFWEKEFVRSLLGASSLKAISYGDGTNFRAEDIPQDRIPTPRGSISNDGGFMFIGDESRLHIKSFREGLAKSIISCR